MPHTALDDMPIYRDAVHFSDRIDSLVRAWSHFDKETVGAQLVRAADSVGANIAESYGRYHYAERIHFLYYARGSAYETIYWLKRAGKRALLAEDTTTRSVAAYAELIAALNRFINSTKRLRSSTTPSRAKGYSTAESEAPYIVAECQDGEVPF